MKEAKIGMLTVKGVSKAEIAVIDLVAKGKSNAQVAEILELKEKTIKFHMNAIFRKLRIKSRTQLVIMVLSDEEEETELKLCERSGGLPVGKKHEALDI